MHDLTNKEKQLLFKERYQHEWWLECGGSLHLS